ncbi:MAG: hypothetical protein P1Q69_20680 [Candidatus Thorarchaeota archaeon]|nr:hypothetical protein [Candidatus Thorarchaeota archaeon]
MASIRIELDEYEYTAGELLTGTLVVKSPYEYRFSSIRLILSASEKTRVGSYEGGIVKVRTSWSHDEFCTESKLHFRKEQDIQIDGSVIRGVERVPFKIEIPLGYPQTFVGEMSMVEYTLEAQVYSESTPEHCVSTNLIVRDRIPYIEPKEIIEETRGLAVKLQTDSFCIGNGLSAMIRVTEQNNIRGVRFEIINTEHARVDSYSRTITFPTIKGYLPGKKVFRDKWIGIEMELTRDVLPSTKGALFVNKNELKITLDLAYKLDIILRIPVNLVFCKREGECKLEFDDIF